MKLFLKWVACVAAILLGMAVFQEKVSLANDITSILGAGTILWLINLLIRPLAQLIALPLSLVTMGLASLIVNTGMVALMDAIFSGISINGFWAYLFIAAATTLMNLILAPGKHSKV